MTKQNIMNNFNDEQRKLIGILISRKKGIVLAEAHPEILDLYKNGQSYDSIAQIYVSDYERSLSVAINSVYYCIREFAEQEKITIEEIVELGKNHIKTNSRIAGKKGGTITFQNKTGCFGLDKKTRSELSKKIAKKMGDTYGLKNYQAGLGIASLSKEQLSSQAKSLNQKLGIASYDDQKLELYCGYMTEREFYTHLKENERLSWKDITCKVNSRFGNNRKPESIRTLYNENKRKSYR